jgi:hypothetical protein
MKIPIFQVKLNMDLEGALKQCREWSEVRFWGFLIEK